jgi:hypothetical protein
MESTFHRHNKGLKWWNWFCGITANASIQIERAPNCYDKIISPHREYSNTTSPIRSYI